MLEHSRSVDIRVGAFVVASLVLLIVGSLWIGGSSLSGARGTNYEVRLQDSGGVQAGDRVRYAGVAVGRVRSVHLDPEGGERPVRLAVALDADLPLRADSTARIASSGLLGGSVLVIEGGSPEEPLLERGGVIQGVAVPSLDETLAHVDELGERAILILDKLAVMMDQVSVEIEPLMKNANRLLSAENADNVGATLASLRDSVDALAPRIPPLLDRVESLAATLEKDLGAVPELTEQATALLEQLQQAFGPGGERLAAVLETAEGTLLSADDTLAVLSGSRHEIEWTLRDLRDAVANLKAFSQQIKERPFSLVRIKSEPDRRPGEKPGGGRP